MAPSKKTTKKSTTAAPVVSKFKAAAKSFRVGGDIRPKRDLSRYVRWPRYVRIQRQKKVLMERLKVPPVLNQFSKTLDKNQSSQLMKLLKKYQPETGDAKAERVEALAKAKANGEKAPSGTPPAVLKFGLKHVTTLIEQKKALLVCIAHDVNPIELVVWLPALCRKMDVPFCIVKGKGRLGELTNMKNSAVVALTAVNSEDKATLDTLRTNFKEQYGKAERTWGGGKMGLKTQAMLDKRAAYLAEEEKKKALTMA
jgi:large subunit ribosomal protein L7Ae